MGGLTRWDPAHWALGRGWSETVGAFLQGAQGRALGEAVQRRLAAGAVIYPPEPLRALVLTPRDEVRVVILGQDPYHGPGQAEGLAFSVPAGVRTPPSLRNILREVARDLGRPWTGGSSLECWARQGVLLLNTHLTVEQGQPASHARLGWERLTDALIADCGQSKRPLAFLLWGAHAQARAALIDDTRHLVLRANHPSPLSALRPPVPFIGCGHFGRVNAWLSGHAQKPIDWFFDGSKSMA